MRIQITRDCSHGRKGEIHEYGDGICDGLIRRGYAIPAPVEAKRTRAPRNKAVKAATIKGGS